MLKTGQGSELSPVDALVQQAARADYEAKLTSMDPRERLYGRAAFLVISGFFAPRSGEPNPEQIIAWREYASEHYRQATGVPLRFAKENLTVWENARQEAGLYFRIKRDAEIIDKVELARAILNHAPEVIFDPTDHSGSSSVDAPEPLLPNDRSSG